MTRNKAAEAERLRFLVDPQDVDLLNDALAAAKAEGYDEGFRAGFPDGVKAEERSVVRQIELDKAKAEGARWKQELYRILDDEAAR